VKIGSSWRLNVVQQHLLGASRDISGGDDFIDPLLNGQEVVRVICG
jgi:hypothetical protein